MSKKMPFSKLFKKSEKKKNEEVKLFLDDYQALCIKHKKRLRPIVEFKHEGVIPNMVTVDFNIPEIKVDQNKNNQNDDNKQTLSEVQEKIHSGIESNEDSKSKS